MLSLNAATELFIKLLLDDLIFVWGSQIHSNGRLTLDFVSKLVDVEELELWHVIPSPSGVARLELEIQSYKSDFKI